MCDNNKYYEEPDDEPTEEEAEEKLMEELGRIEDKNNDTD